MQLKLSPVCELFFSTGGYPCCNTRLKIQFYFILPDWLPRGNISPIQLPHKGGFSEKRKTTWETFSSCSLSRTPSIGNWAHSMATTHAIGMRQIVRKIAQPNLKLGRTGLFAVLRSVADKWRWTFAQFVGQMQILEKIMKFREGSEIMTNSSNWINFL